MKKLLGVLAVSAAFVLSGASGAGAEKLRLKMGSAFPSKIIQIGSMGVQLEKTVDAVSGGEIQLKFFEPGALVPALELFDAVKSGSIDASWSNPGYWQGKEPALALFGSVPFGPATGEYTAWLFFGGGEKKMQEIYAKHGLYSMICGVIAPEASGWFREEITSVDQLKGKKMRFFGLGAKVMQKLGVDTQLLAAGDIYPALERGTLDATEFSMPAIDLDLGFYQIAKHYYFPGWHQQATMHELLLNKEHWESMTATQQAQLQTSCRATVLYGFAQGEAIQGKALKTLQEKGVNFHRWTDSDLSKLKAAWDEVVAEQAAGDATFKEVWEDLQAFRAEYEIWGELSSLKK